MQWSTCRRGLDDTPGRKYGFDLILASEIRGTKRVDTINGEAQSLHHEGISFATLADSDKTQSMNDLFAYLNRP